MNFFEWLLERNPGPVGDIGPEVEREPPASALAVISTGILSILGIGVILYFLITTDFVSKSIWIRVLSFCAYLLLAAKIRATPDYENIGMFGTIFDHPFRYTDDLNRSLLYLQIILFPGKLLIFPTLFLLKLLISKVRG